MKLLIEGIQKSYGQNVVLNNISYNFEHGKIYTILGKNGSGKTTLFSGIAHKGFFDSGQIYLTNNEGEKNKISYEDIGYISATPSLPDFITGYEFVKFMTEVISDQKIDENDIWEQLERVDLSKEDGKKIIKNYSLGMKCKLQILGYVINKPKIILMDEPLVSLDIISSAHIKKIIKKMKNNHIILFSTHIMSLANDLGDEIILLKDGNLQPINWEKGTNEDLENEVVRLFNKGNSDELYKT